MAGFDEDSLDQSLKNVAKDDAPLTSGALDLNSAPKTRDSDVSSAQAPSPFLPDTKVEKRPLGGLNAEEPDHTPVRANANDDQTYGRSDPDAQLPPANSAADAPLPAELHSDLVAIEADSGPADQPVPQPTLATATKPSAQPTQAQSATDAVKPSQKTSSVLGAALPKDASSAQSGPTSIPKQYREEPSTSDENSGSIYDTDSYHQPLDHPPKKKSGWMWVLWILLILLVGAAGGAGIYFMGML